MVTVRRARGSSPRGRGKPERRGRWQRRYRLIPARAGKTRKTALAWARRGGSSPRGRGKREGGHPRLARVRLIPARAGKTSASWCGTASSPAHPRAGGENIVPRGRSARAGGSSPRGRGKLGDAGARALLAGLIPARAGKTGGTRSRLCGRWAHPRAGGENPKTPTWGPSSPAHPRAGGENRGAPHRAESRGGSSPRGRGKHFLTCAFIKRIGQILETLELAVSSESYSLCDVYATDAPQDQARNTGLALPSSRAAS